MTAWRLSTGRSRSKAPRAQAPGSGPSFRSRSSAAPGPPSSGTARQIPLDSGPSSARILPVEPRSSSESRGSAFSWHTAAGAAPLPSPGRRQALIEAQGLTKLYGDFVAVDGIDFSVERGETFGFLGPNGAGKSSTMRMIGAVSPRAGDPSRPRPRSPARRAAIRERLGSSRRRTTSTASSNVGENLLVYGRFFGLRATRSAAGAASCWSSSSSPTAVTLASTRCPAA